MKNLTWLDFKLTMAVWSKSQMRQSKVRRRGGEATHPPTNSIFLLPLFAGVHKIIPWSRNIVEGDPKKGPFGSKKLSKRVNFFWEEAQPTITRSTTGCSCAFFYHFPLHVSKISGILWILFSKLTKVRSWQIFFNQRNQIKHKSDIPNTLKYFFSTWNPSHMYDLHKYYHQI